MSRGLSLTARALLFYVRFDHGLLDAVDGEDVGVVVKVAADVGDVGASGEAEGVQGQVAHSGQVPGSCARSELGIVFAEGDVSGPMQTIFHRSVSSHISVEVLRAGLLGVETDDAVDGLYGVPRRFGTVDLAWVTQ